MFRDALQQAVDRFLRNSDIPLEIYFTGLRSGAISALADVGVDLEEARSRARQMTEVARCDPIARELLREALIRTLNGEQLDELVKITAYGFPSREENR
jgi:hypothetical protein